MHIFHKWSKWEEYNHRYSGAYYGFWIPEEQRGVTREFSDLREKRVCEVCGKTQDRLIREG